MAVELAVVTAAGASILNSHKGRPSGFVKAGWLVAHDRYALYYSLLCKITEHKVLCAAVILHGDSAFLPSIPDRKFRLGDPFKQIAQ